MLHCLSVFARACTLVCVCWFSVCFWYLWYGLHGHASTCAGLWPTPGHAAFVWVYAQETIGGSCFSRVKRTFNTQLGSKSWHSDSSLNTLCSIGRYLKSDLLNEIRENCLCIWFYVCVLLWTGLQYVCQSRRPMAWPVWLPEITHWQINGLSWPSSLLHAALCRWPSLNSNTVTVRL